MTLDDWRIARGKYGNILHLHVDWKDDFLAVIKKECIQELVLFKLHGAEWESLDFLSNLPWLKGFTLLGSEANDMRGLRFLNHLESLYLGDYSDEKVDFLQFPFLRECRLEFCKGRSSFVSCKLLELLALIHCPYKDLSKITSLSRLSRLSFYQGSLGDLSEIGAFSDLVKLDLALLRNLKDISHLSQLTKLEKLELANCRGITNLDALSSIASLRSLNISNCGEIESLAPLLACKNLETLFAYEDTIIRDGNIAVLLQLKKLNDVRLKSRKHYNLKTIDVPEFNVERRALQRKSGA